VKNVADNCRFLTLTKSEIDDKIKTRAAGDQLIAFFCIISRERILCSIKCQNMRINMQSNLLEYALESLKYALLFQNMQVYRIT
jgi:hypothetical protein